MSQTSLRDFFSRASTSGNGSEKDSESEEEQHAPSNSVRRSHGYKSYCNLALDCILLCSSEILRALQQNSHLV